MPDEPLYDEDDRRKFAVRKPSRWRWLKRLGGSVFVSLLCYFCWVLAAREWTRRDGERELAAAHAKLEHADPDWTWERLNAARPKPPAGKNGAELIPRIKALTHADWGKAQRDPELMTKLDPVPNVRYSPLVLIAIRKEMIESADAVMLARSFKDYPSGHREIVLALNPLITLLPDTQNTREAADLLRWDTVFALEDGDPRRAADDLLAILNTSRSIGDEPFLISQLFRMAVRTVSVQSTERLIAQVPDAPDLSELQAAFAADAEEPLLLYGVRGDRATFDRHFDNLHTGIMTPEEGIDAGFKDPSARFGWWHYRANLPGDRAYTLNWLTYCVEAARRPLHEQPALFAALPIPPKGDPTKLLSRTLLPAVDKVAEAHWRTTAMARCAVAGIACERFCQQHKRWPNELAELVPACVPAVPLDPYTAEPLRYAKSERGVIVYSVGQDRTHDGGALDTEEPTPKKQARFRLWNTDQRRQPPPAEPPAPEPDP